MRKTRFGIGTVLAALIATWPILAAAQENGMFPDVPKTHWAYQAVYDLKQKGILVGYPAPSSQPSRPAKKQATKSVKPRHSRGHAKGRPHRRQAGK